MSAILGRAILGRLNLGGIDLSDQTTEGAAGISSLEGFGSGGTVTGPVSGSSGVVTAEAFGTDGTVATEESIVGGSGIASEEAFGSGGTAEYELPGSAGIASAEAFGVGGSCTGPVTGSAGITSEEGFGAVDGRLEWPIDGSYGIETAEAFGADGAVLGPITGQTGIPSAEAFGTDGTCNGPINGSAGIPSSEQFGSGLVATVMGPVTGSAGIPSAEAFGSDGLVTYLIEGSSGIASEASVTSGGDVLLVAVGYLGIESAEQMGSGGTVWIAVGDTPMPPIVPPSTGTPPIPSTRMRLYIDGTDRSGMLLHDSSSANLDMTSAGSASFTLVDLNGRYEPLPGHEVVWEWGIYRLFGGFVTKCEIECFEGSRATKIHVSCTDYRRVLDDRTYTKRWNGPTFDFRTIVKDIVAQGLSGENIGYPNDAETSIVPGLRLEFVGETVTQCLSRMAGYFGYNIWVDQWKVLHGMRALWYIAPYSLRDQYTSDGRIAVWSNLKRSRDDSQYRNQQGGRTPAPVAGQQYALFYGDGTKREWTLQQAVTGKPNIKVNGTAMTVVAFSERGAAPYDFWYEVGSRAIHHNPANAVLTNSEIVQVYYPAANLDVTATINSADQARRAAITGGSGISEAVSLARNVRDLSSITAINQTMLERYGSELTEISFTSYLPGWELGQVIHVFTEEPPCAGMYMVKSIQMHERSMQFIEYNITCQAPSLPDIKSIETIDNGDGTTGIEIETYHPTGLGPGGIITTTGLGQEPYVHITAIAAALVSGHWELTFTVDRWPGTLAGESVRTSDVEITATGGMGLSYGQPEARINGTWRVQSVDVPGKKLLAKCGIDNNPDVDFVGLVYKNPPDGRLTGAQTVHNNGNGTWETGTTSVHITAIAAVLNGASWVLTFTVAEWFGALAGNGISTRNIEITATGGDGLSYGQPVRAINGTWNIRSVDSGLKQIVVWTNADGNPVVDFSGFSYDNAPDGLMTGARNQIPGTFGTGGTTTTVTGGQVNKITAMTVTPGGTAGTWVVRCTIDHLPQAVQGDTAYISQVEVPDNCDDVNGSYKIDAVPAPPDKYIEFTTGQLALITAVETTAGVDNSSWTVKVFLTVAPAAAAGDVCVIEGTTHSVTPLAGNTDAASRRNYAAIHGINGTWKIDSVNAGAKWITFKTKDSDSNNGPLDIVGYQLTNAGAGRCEMSSNGNAALDLTHFSYNNAPDGRCAFNAANGNAPFQGTIPTSGTTTGSIYTGQPPIGNQEGSLYANIIALTSSNVGGWRLTVTLQNWINTRAGDNCEMSRVQISCVGTTGNPISRINGTWKAYAVDSVAKTVTIRAGLDGNPSCDFNGLVYLNSPNGVFRSPEHAGDGIGTGWHRIIAVNNTTAEVTTHDAHGFTSYTSGGTLVKIFGVTAPRKINIAFTRVVVTAPNRFIAYDVSLQELAFDEAFINDGHGQCTDTHQVIHLATGPTAAIENIHGLGAGSASSTSERATFILANTVPGVLTRPLATGANQTNPWIAQRDLMIVESVTGIVGTPSDGGDIQIMVRQNGVGILNNPLTIPGGSTELVTTTDFVSYPMTVERGDKFTVDVVSVPTGQSDFPGCNAVVNVNFR